MNRVSVLCGCAMAAAASAAGPATAEAARAYAIPPGSLADVLTLYASQSGRQIFFPTPLVEGRTSAGLSGRYEPDDALRRLLAGTGLTWSTTPQGLIYLRRAATETETVRAAATAELSEIIVTGTLLRSSGPPSSPVVTLDRDTLDRRGLGTVAEVLVDLPQNYAGAGTPIATTTGADRGGSNGAYATGVNLRGLGPQSTLLLIDGRRLAGSGFRGELNDLSALPSGAVERVDVLLDGASAIYGSDAVAGVVNVVMRRAFDGQETRVRLGAVEGGGEDLIVSHVVGRTWGSGAALIAYEYQDANGLSSLDRAYTRDGDLRPFGGSDRRNLFSSPGNIVVYDPVARAYRAQWAIRPPAGGVATGPSDFAAGETNLQSVSLGADLTPAIKRHSLYGRFRQSIGDLDLSGDLRFSQRDYDMAGAASLGVFTVTGANPYFVSPSGAAAHTIASSFYGDLGPTRQFGQSRSLGASLGGAYDLGGDWSLDGYLAYAEERGESGVSNRLNTAFLNEALGVTADNPATPFKATVDGYFNPFGDGAANSAAVLDFIGSGYVDGLDRSRNATFNLMADGPVARLPGGVVQVAVGGQVRRETFASRTESLTAAVPVLSVAPDAERTIAAVFGEVRIPLIGEGNRRPGAERLEVSIAGRFEDYDDFGSTVNPKLGLVWSPMDTVLVRASYGSSYRAPTLQQRTAQSVTTGTFLAGEGGAQALVLYLYGGNADLKPETADTWTTGVEWRPTPATTLSLNYFYTRFENRISQPATENLSVALIDPSLSPFVRFLDPAGNPDDRALVTAYITAPGYGLGGQFPVESYQAIVDGRWVNAASVVVRGLDLSGRTTVTRGEQSFSGEASASYLFDYETRTTEAAPAVDAVGLVGRPQRLRARAGVNWTRRDWSAGVFANHVSAGHDLADREVNAWTTADVRIAWSPSSPALAGLEAALSIQNLFDRAASFYDAPSGFGFDPGQANPFGRMVALQLIRRW
ncbi:MAG: TonB-dependent receptor domain-containing protein [Brevundimonas sp.]